MPAKTDAKAADDPVSDQQSRQILPTKRPQNGYRQQMKRRNHNDISPIYRLSDFLKAQNILH